MATYDLPTTDTEFTPHPAGQHEGFIAEIEDKGMVSTQFGDKHKLSIKVESTTSFMEGGDGTKGYGVWQWVTVSGHERSGLTNFRKQVLGRDLSADERAKFNVDDYIGKKVGYVVVHAPSTKDPSKVFANIQAIWPLVDDSGMAEPAAIEALKQAEETTGLDETPIKALRQKYTGTGDLVGVTSASVATYQAKLNEFNGTAGADDDAMLPF